MPTTLELYIVRHAVAALRGPDYPDDAERPLTEEGAAKWRRSVAGLRELGVTLDLVLSSPYVRARETADILAAGLRPKPRVVVVDALAAGRRLGEQLDVVAKHASAARGPSQVAVVGHEPDLGELARALLGAKGSIAFKKGAVCRIDLDGALPRGPGVLRWHLPPAVSRGLAP